MDSKIRPRLIVLLSTETKKGASGMALDMVSEIGTFGGRGVQGRPELLSLKTSKVEIEVNLIQSNSTIQSVLYITK